MKTFADVKRRLAKGVILLCVENTKRPEISGTYRIIEKVQTNAIACYFPGKDGRYWTYFPKAKGVEIIDRDTFRMRLGDAYGLDDAHTVTLRFVDAPSALEFMAGQGGAS